jgi:hypothetical protein
LDKGEVKMIDIFDKRKIDLANIICHSGGASGSDTEFEIQGYHYDVKTRAYSYKTKSHISPNKVEISDEDYQEGIIEIKKANKILNRYGIEKYMNLLARNWAQVKYSDQIIAIGRIVKQGERGSKGYYNRGKMDVVDGGTGYAVMMGINHNKLVHVFDQDKCEWYRWSYSTMSFVKMREEPMIEYHNFAGIGTREINENGKKAIADLYKRTFNDR